jgi:hypothetical protein
VAILGPRQIGKTTLALEIAKGQRSIYLDLEDPQDFQNLRDPVGYMACEDLKAKRKFVVYSGDDIPFTDETVTSCDSSGGYMFFLRKTNIPILSFLTFSFGMGIYFLALTIHHIIASTFPCRA